VLGLSWGGALAQQFAFQYPRRCRRLILVSTGTGILMIPGRPTGLLKMLTLPLIRRPTLILAGTDDPIINQHWQRGSFPFEIVPGLRQLGIAGLPYHGFGCPGRSYLLDGMVAMELARTDPSIATFAGVHGGLSMGSIYLCGDDTQRERFLPDMARLAKIGAFGLTEPEVGSGASGGLRTTARREGDTWVLNGRKKWIGNATFGDRTVIWVKDVTDGQVKGFVVANDTPGFSTEKLVDKIALRVVQNALITLTDVRVPEADRLQRANSFRDTAAVLRMTRAGVAWMAVGCARGAYENALRYALEREQFGRPIAGFQLVQDPLVRMLGNITSSWALCARLSQLQDQGRAEDHHRNERIRLIHPLW
jgi:glutaryl-CoA dehydrogenase